ncbi:solute carrier family 2 facilitated glucose transporter member 3-like protein [Perkinsela sp. CCAP 1560/4]|nr:solute carrier family 2 facilitated glucose transporter member 3-like protein [Perkinsela sp. CCAP 1560/4]|eukprot:KNH08228.1 solute carrier family 2 facilitated glucose transporter member 3-like protein [Perkinsela sp. CCAP 1560/4]
MESARDSPLECNNKDFTPITEPGSGSKKESTSGCNKKIVGRYPLEQLDSNTGIGETCVNADDELEYKKFGTGKHVSFLEEEKERSGTSFANHESKLFQNKLKEKYGHTFDSAKRSAQQEDQINPLSSSTIKTKDYTSKKPKILSNSIGKFKALFRDWFFSPEETQKRLHLLNKHATNTSGACTGSLADTSKHVTGLDDHHIEPSSFHPSLDIPARKNEPCGSGNPPSILHGTRHLHDSAWSRPIHSAFGHDKLSKENLSTLNEKSSPSNTETKDHSVACAMVNILGGLILGYADVGVNTALSVLYPCALQMVPEHSHMWKIAGLLSIVNIGAALGSLMGGYSAEKYGRKWSMVVGGVISIAPVMTMFVRSYQLQLISRIITGMGIGITSSICGTYVSEMAPANSRGFLNSFFEVSINSGILLANVVTYFVLGVNRDLEVDEYCYLMGDHPIERAATSNQMIWAIMLGAVLIAGLFVSVVLSPLVPESKVWLAKRSKCAQGSHPDRDSVFSRSTLPQTPIEPNKGRSPGPSNDEVLAPHFRHALLQRHLEKLPGERTHYPFDEQSLTMISVGWAAARSSSEGSIEERDATLNDFPVATDCLAPPEDVKLCLSIEEPIKPYDSRRVRTTASLPRKLAELKKPIAIAIFDAVALQLTGMYALMFYCHKFLEVGHINQKMLGTLGIMFWNWASTFISLSLVERVGRRRLLIPSMCILTATIASMPLAIVYGKGATHGVFFLFLLLAIYIAAYEVGPGVLFWVICAEVFPHDIAQMSFALVNCFQWILMVFVTFLFPPLQKLLGGWVFFVFLFPSLVSTVFFYFVLPETKGRSRREVAKEMRKSQWITENRRIW